MCNFGSTFLNFAGQACCEWSDTELPLWVACCVLVLHRRAAACCLQVHQRGPPLPAHPFPAHTPPPHQRSRLTSVLTEHCSVLRTVAFRDSTTVPVSGSSCTAADVHVMEPGCVMAHCCTWCSAWSADLDWLPVPLTACGVAGPAAAAAAVGAPMRCMGTALFAGKCMEPPWPYACGSSIRTAVPSLRTMGLHVVHVQQTPSQLPSQESNRVRLNPDTACQGCRQRHAHPWRYAVCYNISARVQVSPKSSRKKCLHRLISLGRAQGECWH